MSEERLNSIENRLDKVEDTQDRHSDRQRKLENDVSIYNNNMMHIDRRLGKIEGGQTWVIRLVIGSILSAALLFALNGGLISVN